jgi:hypothetical protein
MTAPFRLPGVKYFALYDVKVFPNRWPISKSHIWLHKSMSPFGDGVPVRRITRLNCGRTRLNALNLFAEGFLKLELSSMITISKGQGHSLYLSTSHTTFSRFMT